MIQLSPSNVLTLLAALSLVSQSLVQGFGVISVGSPLKTRALAGLLHSTQGDDDFPRNDKDEYTGDVDWDAEWKKVVESEKTSTTSTRPGKDFYKSEAEIAAIRAANKAKVEVVKMSDKLPSPPSMNMQSLTGDWKFWIGILALISIGSAVLSAPPSYDAISNGDSYFI